MSTSPCASECSVIFCPLARIAEHLVGFVQFAHAEGSIRARMHVGVVFPRKPPVRGFDNLLLRVAANLKDVVVVFHAAPILARKRNGWQESFYHHPHPPQTPTIC